MILGEERARLVAAIDSGIETDALVAAHRTFERALMDTCRASGRGVADVLGLTLAYRRAGVEDNARGAALLADFDVEGALRCMVRALLADPTNRDARANQAMLVPLVSEAAAAVRIQQMTRTPDSDSGTLLRTHGRPYASDPFRQPVTALPLDGRRGLAYLYCPRWSDSHWFDVIAAYVGAFSSADDVTLVVWLDPAQGVTEAEAGERILAALAAAHIDPATIPDLLLVPDRLDSDGEARLYAAVDCVIPNGDAAVEDRALWSGADILVDVAPAQWRAATPRRKNLAPRETRAPRVSCLIITYNYGHYLQQAIESVLAQDYPSESLEIIVVDDGSTDGTPHVVAPFLDRVRYIRKANGGLVSAMSRGIEQATGEFIAILDGDDTWPVDKTRRQVERLMTQPEAGLVYGDMTLIDAESNVIGPSFFQHHNVTPLRGEVYAALNKWNFIAGGSMMIRASLKRHFFPIASQAPWPDWWIALQIARVAPVELIGGSVYNYRYHGNNMGLMANGARQGKQSRAEIPLRRRLLASAPHERMSLQDVLEAYLTFEQIANQASQLLELPMREVVHVSDADTTEAHKSFADAVAADQAGDKDQALRHVVRAVAFNPWHPAGRGVVRQIVPALSEQFGGVAA